jgi:hypothetical protein
MKKIMSILVCLLIPFISFGQLINNTKLDSAIIKADRLIETDSQIFFKNVQKQELAQLCIITSDGQATKYRV